MFILPLTYFPGILCNLRELRKFHVTTFILLSFYTKQVAYTPLQPVSAAPNL